MTDGIVLVAGVVALAVVFLLDKDGFHDLMDLGLWVACVFLLLGGHI